MATNHFDQYDGPSADGNYFDKFDEKPAPEKRNAFAVANDTVIEAANAAASGVSAAANFVKPGNAVSKFIDEKIVKAGEQSQSDVTKAAKKKFREEVDAADGIGGELQAVGSYVAENPLLSAAQAAGSFVGPGAAVKGAGAAGRALGAGAKGVERAGLAGGAAAGAAMAGGDAAGTAHDLARNAGANEEQATAAGRSASLIPAAIGGLGGVFGAERLLAGAKGFSGGAAARALKTAASEAGQEALEEGVTQYEGQRAAMPFDPNIDPSKGVAAAAGMGAALGGITGGGVSLLTGGHGQGAGLPGTQAAEGAPPAAPLLLTNEPDPLVGFPDGTVGRQSEVDAYLAGLPEDQRAAELARLMGLAPQPVQEPDRAGAEAARRGAITRLNELGQQERGEPEVQQVAPPDGAAVLARQREDAARVRQAELDASRAVASPDDEILESTGAVERPALRPSQAMGIDPAAGPLSAGAAIAVDGGAAAQMQLQLASQQAEEAPQRGAREEPARQVPGVDANGVIDSPENTQGLAEWTDEQLRAQLQGARSAEVRQLVREELALREQQRLQEELAAEQRAPAPTAPGLDEAFTRLDVDTSGTAAEAEKEPRIRAPRAPSGAAPVVRPAKWRTNALQARQVAKSLGIDISGMRTPQIVAAIDARDAQAQPKPQGGQDVAAARGVRVADDRARGAAGAAPDAAGRPDRGARPDGGAGPRGGDTGRAAPAVRAAVPDAAGAGEQQPALSAAPAAQPAAAVNAAANEAATSPQNDRPEPSQAQKEAGNYKMGHLSGEEVQGLRISIENPQGSTRSGTSPDGRAWSNTMGAHYGYVKGSEAADGDHVDVFVGPAAATAPTVYVVDQVNPDGSYDEAKALFGFNSEAEAVAAYRSSYDTDWKVGPVTAMSVNEFKAGLASGQFKKPVDQSLAATKPARSVIAKMKEAKAKRETKTARMAREAEEARAAYFTPGNVVRGYGSSFDRVIAYHAPTEPNGRWSVEVVKVLKTGPSNFADIPGERSRVHATPPSATQLRAGPAGKVEAKADRESAPPANGDRFAGLFHGTALPMEEFEIGRRGGAGYHHQGPAIYLTDDRAGLARFFAGAATVNVGRRDTTLTEDQKDAILDSGGVVLNVDVSPDARILDMRADGVPTEVQSLFDRAVGDREVGEQLRDKVLELGYDGIAFSEPNRPEGWDTKPDAVTLAIYRPEKALIKGSMPADPSSSSVEFRRDGTEAMPSSVANAMRALSRPSYSPDARAQAVASVSKTVDAIRAAWGNGPEVVVAFDMGDPVVPAAARRADLKQRSGGARGAPEGFYYRGKAYLMASRLASPNDAARVLFHEVLGHHGLRSTFGKSLQPILQQIATMRRAEVDAKIKEYGLRGVNRLDRLAAAEEVLAEMAQTRPDLHFVRRAIAAIRTWLRTHVPGFTNLRMTDDEIVRNFILPARQFVERGGDASADASGVAYSLSPATREAFEARIDALYSGDKPKPQGVRILDRSDVLGLLGMGEGPVHLVESKVEQGRFNHGLTAADWKKVPAWLENPAAVFGSDTSPGRLVFIGPELVRGVPVRMIVDPRPEGDGVNLLINAYEAERNPFERWERDGLLRYFDRQKATPVTGSFQPRLTGLPGDRGRSKILTEKQLGGYRRANADPTFSRSTEQASQQPATTAELQSPGVVQQEASSATESTPSAQPDVGTDDEAPMFSRSAVQGFAKTAAAELNKTFSAPGKLSWWHKTVGTMYNLAERSPAFKGVFDAAQSFVDDVSYYATDAAELAPKLLPKLETWRDIKKAPVSAADNAAVAKPVFEGTLTWARDESGKPVPVQSLIDAATGLTADQKAQRLLRNGMIDERMLKAWKGMPLESYEKAVSTRYESRMLQAGVVWSDAELRSMFQLTDGQIALYREFRQATDRSLDTMARADMLRFAGDDAKALRDMVMDAPDAQVAAVLLRDHLAQLASEQPDRSTLLMNTANGIIDRADKVRDLQLRGYAPLSRFGRYTVDVVNQAGERQYFGLFETAREANAMAARMREEFGDAAVSQGTLSEEAFKLFAGVTPETLELFGNALGLDSTGDTAQDQAFQEYLRLTKTNRSAMRRLIHRKGIAGFSEDVGRVLAAFVYSNARQTAAGLHMGDLGDAVIAIPKEQGELKDAAVRLAEYVKNPQEEAQAVRGLLFAQYLGGSVASAFVNMSQPVAVTFPWLSQFGGARAAAAQIGRAAKDLAARGRNIEPELAAALKRAEAEGIVAPQEVHQLMAQARGASTLRGGDGTRAGDLQALGQNAMSRLSLAWGKLFGAAEQVNRRLTFIAAYRTAKAQGMDDPAGFARQAITETQFLYSKANKMQWARGAVGGTLMTFKTYSVAYLELLHRMYTRGGPEGKRAALLALAVLLLMGGAGGLPFAEDLEDAADGLAQLLGYNFSAKKARQEFLEGFLPRGLAQFIDKGVSGLPGAPLDVSGRLGMGNLIPGTGLLTEKTSHARDVLEIAGPAGDFASRILSGGRQILTGDVGAGLLEMSPAAVRNAAKGADMAATGMYRDAKGYKVLDTNTLEAALKAIGFQPQSVATIQEANRISQGAKSFYNQRAQEIRAQWAQGVLEGDPDKVQAARDQVAAWNRKNPEQPMLIRVPDIMRRVREMRKSKDERIADTAPRAMRQQLREDAAKVRADLGS